MNEAMEISDDVLGRISAGNPDGGAPMQTQTTTTTTTSFTASGSLAGGYKKIVGAGASGSIANTTETTVETIKPCPMPVDQWRGVPYR